MVRAVRRVSPDLLPKDAAEGRVHGGRASLGAHLHAAPAPPHLLLRVQRDRAVHHAVGADAAHVLAAADVRREGQPRTVRLPRLLHVHAADRRGSAGDVRVRPAHR